jgi:hypothetical protein
MAVAQLPMAIALIPVAAELLERGIVSHRCAKSDRGD